VRSTELHARVAARLVSHAVAAQGADREVVIDPVCRMAVNTEGAAGTLTHNGSRYYFCSLECAARFAGNPGLYADAEAL
jgi:Cu+-exporting ATPase